MLATLECHLRPDLAVTTFQTEYNLFGGFSLKQRGTVGECCLKMLSRYHVNMGFLGLTELQYNQEKPFSPLTVKHKCNSGFIKLN